MKYVIKTIREADAESPASASRSSFPSIEQQTLLHTLLIISFFAISYDDALIRRTHTLSRQVIDAAGLRNRTGNDRIDSRWDVHVLHLLCLRPRLSIALQVATQIIAGVGRLIVADVLVKATHPVAVVGHEPGKLMGGGVPGRENLDVLQTRSIGNDHLFAPVANQVAIPRRIGLGAIDKGFAVTVHGEGTTVLRTLDDIILDELARQVAVEPYGHAATTLLSFGIDGGLAAILPDVVALIVEEFTAGVFRKEVAYKAATHIVVGTAVFLPDDASVAGIM